jgi:hypothetical protein
MSELSMMDGIRNSQVDQEKESENSHQLSLVSRALKNDGTGLRSEVFQQKNDEAISRVSHKKG